MNNDKMEIISTNLGKLTTIVWQNKTVETGIFKKPVQKSLSLEVGDVKNDIVADRKDHAGLDKSCYLFSADHYSFWKEKHPDLDWDFGMFGENLTVKNCNEKEINIGDTYKVGTAILQVSQPRQPCFKLGIRFNTQRIIKEFINQPYPGIYFRVLQEGDVKIGDLFTRIKRVKNGVSVSDSFKALYDKNTNPALITKLMSEEFLADSFKKDLAKSR